MWQKRKKGEVESGGLCRDSVLSFTVDLKGKFERAQEWWVFELCLTSSNCFAFKEGSFNSDTGLLMLCGSSAKNCSSDLIEEEGNRLLCIKKKKKIYLGLFF